jgi:hypothetical protein
MKSYKVLYNEGFKDCCFDGLQFPFTVKGVLIKTGTMKGWLMFKGSELKALGCTSWLVDDEMEFEFSPAAFKII